MRLRWKITAHKIAPHTTAPTQSAAIQLPRHRVTTTSPCLVTGTGRPSRVNVVDWQPAVAMSTAASSTERGIQRRSRRPGWRWPSSGEPAVTAPAATEPSGTAAFSSAGT